MKKMIVSVAVATMMFLAVSCGMASAVEDEKSVDTDKAQTDNTVTDDTVDNEVVDNEEATDNNEPVDNDELVADEIVTDELATDNEVPDELFTDDIASDETVTDETVTDDVINDEMETDNEVSDDSVTLPEITVQSLNGFEIEPGASASILILSSQVVIDDLCVAIGMSGASLGVEYGLSGSFATCGAGTIKLVAGTNAVVFAVSNGEHSQEKTLNIVISNGEGYTLGEEFAIALTLLGTEETLDEDVVTDDDAILTDEMSDDDSVEETDSITDADEIDTDTSESEDDVLADVDETPDADNDTDPLIIATDWGPAPQCRIFQTLLKPGTKLELWDDVNHQAGLVVTNNLQVPVWYLHNGWCAATSNLPMDAKGEYPYSWEATDVQCVAHNGDLC